MKVIVVIPAFNEEKKIATVLQALQHSSFNTIVVVDDASTDRTGDIAQKAGVDVVTHLLNRGLGGALGTGIQRALELDADIVVTFDADGQHSVSDLSRLVAPISAGEADVVIGSRLLTKQGMPLIRQLYNIVGNGITYLLFGMKVTDSQSGLRAFNRSAAASLQLRANRMEVSSEIIQEIKIHHLRYREVPIQAIYTQYSLSKGQNLLVGIRTLFKLILLKIIK